MQHHWLYFRKIVFCNSPYSVSSSQMLILTLYVPLAVVNKNYLNTNIKQRKMCGEMLTFRFLASTLKIFFTYFFSLL